MVMPPPIQQANLGMADSLILMVLALVVFGPRRLPQIGRQIGKLMYEFRKASNDFKFQMEEELRNAEEADRRKKEEAERQRTLALSAPAQTGDSAPAASQALEAESLTPGSTASESTATGSGDSAYPDQTQYPRESTHGDFGAQEESADQSHPRILPPSTGETVAAARPGSTHGEDAAAHPAHAEAAATTPAEEESGAATEQAAHNG
jgi:sec-independent protein translocase protein TatB